MIKLILPLMAALSACASTDSGTPYSNGLPSQENRMEAGHAPTPFSAEEIREACTDGAFRLYRLTGEAQPPRMNMSFGPDVEGKVVVTTEIMDEEGAVLGASDAPASSWSAFQAHASFPAERTTITTGTHTTAAGTFDCWTYSVSGPEDTVTNLVFARDLPGSPLRMVAMKDGTPIQGMELIDFGPKPR